MVLELRQGAEETNKNKNASVRWQLQQGYIHLRFVEWRTIKKMIKATEDDEKAITVSTDTPLKRSETTSEV